MPKIGKPETTTCVLKLRLGCCLTGPTKRLAADLHAVARMFNQARNAVVRLWEREAETSEDRTHFSMPASAYAASSAAAPLLARKLCATATQEVAKKLRSKVPWNHPGLARYQWQAILAFETSRPAWRGLDIAVPCQDARLTHSPSGYTLRFPLWSKQAGRKNCFVVCRLPSARLPPGLRRVLQQVSSGEWKLCDSKLIFHEPKSRGKKGHWAYHMAYERPQECLDLDKSRTAVLTLQTGGGAARPFEVVGPDAFPWTVGDAAVLLGEYRRLDERRLQMRARHRDRTEGKRGHGRQRAELAVRPITRAVQQLMHRFSWRVVAKVIEYCVRYNCGRVEWREPGVRVRDRYWFAAKAIPFDFTGFLGRLKHKLWVNGIVLASGEVVDQTPAAARVPQGDGWTPLTATQTLHDPAGQSRKANLSRQKKVNRYGKRVV